VSDNCFFFFEFEGVRRRVEEGGSGAFSGKIKGDKKIVLRSPNFNKVILGHIGVYGGEVEVLSVNIGDGGGGPGKNSMFMTLQGIWPLHTWSEWY